MEILEKQITLRELPVGARLIVRSKKDWRLAVISNFTEEKVTLIVCSPSGRTYRLIRKIDSILVIEGKIPRLQNYNNENWRENFTKYDFRW